MRPNECMCIALSIVHSKHLINVVILLPEFKEIKNNL